MAYFFGLIFYIVCKLVYDAKSNFNFELERAGKNKNANSGNKILDANA